jgi:uncharacterized membrane protein YphA (DoxX/SURF4 family)
VFETYFKDKLGPLTLRLALGLVCVSHGYLKIMASGGTAWNPGMTTGWQLFIAWGEFGAGLAILVGCYCRWACVLVLGLTIGTLAWTQGWRVFRLPLATLEPFLMLLLMGISLLFLGAGEFSLDARGGSSGGSSAGRAPRKRAAA